MNYSTLKFFVILILLFGILNLPYNYYIILRIIVTGFSIYTCYLLQKKKKDFWFYVFIGIAILFNPILPIYLKKEIWIILDFLTAGIILVFGKFKKMAIN